MTNEPIAHSPARHYWIGGQDEWTKENETHAPNLTHLFGSGNSMGCIKVSSSTKSCCWGGLCAGTGCWTEAVVPWGVATCWRGFIASQLREGPLSPSNSASRRAISSMWGAMPYWVWLFRATEFTGLSTVVRAPEEGAGLQVDKGVANCWIPKGGCWPRESPVASVIIKKNKYYTVKNV